MTAVDLIDLNPREMLCYLREHGASDRKLRLFACACCRLIWPSITDERSRRVVEVAERFADGEVSGEELAAAYRAAKPVAWSARIAYGTESVAWRAAKAAEMTARPIVLPLTGLLRKLLDHADAALLLHDLFESLFQPVAVDDAWLSSEVVAFASDVYHQREFGRLPELADLLEAAGCGEEVRLRHLRGSGPHGRGCWALDAQLGLK